MSQVEPAGVSGICEALQIASEVYRFSELEKNTALPLYRCLKPLWYTRVEELKAEADAILAGLAE